MWFFVVLNLILLLMMIIWRKRLYSFNIREWSYVILIWDKNLFVMMYGIDRIFLIFVFDKKLRNLFF